jgi:endonuclease/exonuclease/phosphatase family metal-dependent hydrolase
MRLKRFVLILFGMMLPILTSCTKKAALHAQPIKLMTFNIRYGTAPDGEHSWNLRQDLVYSLLEKERPDILGLQEALNFQIDAIITHLPDYRRLGVGRDDGDTLGEYSAILFRSARFRPLESQTFWFSDTPEVPGSKSWGNSITRICTWAHFSDDSTGLPLYVYNLHLDHQSQPSREKSVALLIQRIGARKNDDPVMVMGDFNAGEDNPAIQALEEFKEPGSRALMFADAFRLLHPQAQEVGTFHAFTDQPGADMIDHIFITKSFSVSHADILRDHPPGRYPSDHFPVAATVAIKP